MSNPPPIVNAPKGQTVDTVALAFGALGATATPVSSTNPIPVTIAGGSVSGGSGTGISESVWTDNTGAFYVRVNNGTTISWTTLAGAPSSAPGAGAEPVSDPNGGLPPSGVTPMYGNFAANGNSGLFTPVCGRPVSITIWGVFSATVALYRASPTGSGSPTQNFPITAGGFQTMTFSAPANERYTEYEYGIQLSLICTNFVSGTSNYRIAQ